MARTSAETDRRGRGVMAFLRARRGATAVEFAIISVPFFWLMFAITEMSLLYLTQGALDVAVMDTQRAVRTGEAQNDGLSANDLRDRLCNRLDDMMAVNCNGNLYLDIRRFDAFRDVTTPPPVVNGNVNAGSFQFQLGAPDQIVLVRAYYAFEINTPFFASVMANVGGDRRLLGSSMLFRTEPYSN